MSASISAASAADATAPAPDHHPAAASSQEGERRLRYRQRNEGAGEQSCGRAPGSSLGRALSLLRLCVVRTGPGMSAAETSQVEDKSAHTAR